ncbi:MAG: hypothetical protein RLO08_08610 [Parvibaculaceae bacterium]
MTDDQEQTAMQARAREVLESYGADPARWPADDRAALVGIVERDPQLAMHRREAEELDRLMAQAPLSPPSYALQQAILKGMPGRAVPGDRRTLLQQVLGILWPYGPASLPAGALAASLVLGVMTGALTGSLFTQQSTGQGYDVVAFALGDTALTEEWQ